MSNPQNTKTTNPNTDSENQSAIDESENKYNSHPEKKPHQDELITTDEQDRSSYKNEYEGSEEDDLNENSEGNSEGNSENSKKSDENQLDHNGFPKPKDSSFPSNL